MSKRERNPSGERITEVLRLLKKRLLIKTDGQIAAELNYKSVAVMTTIKNGTVLPNKKMLDHLRDKYKVNPMYISDGILPMFLNDPKDLPVADKNFELMKETVASCRTIITILAEVHAASTGELSSHLRDNYQRILRQNYNQISSEADKDN